MGCLKRWENRLLAFLLSRMSTQGMDAVVFTEIAKKFVLVTINLVILRLDGYGNAQVLLLRRSTYDPCWPGELHIPGTVLRGYEASGSPIGSTEPISRIEQKELGAKLKSPPIYIGEAYLSATRRGPEVTKIFLGELDSDIPEGGGWFSLGGLPRDVGIMEEALILRAAVSYYRGR